MKLGCGKCSVVLLAAAESETEGQKHACMKARLPEKVRKEPRQFCVPHRQMASLRMSRTWIANWFGIRKLEVHAVQSCTNRDIEQMF